ncbi:hypothetical protein [Novosphingobium sp. CECT 9465]|uniref:hypothetical protein n=1 Tax=Novosphingobium sp. CECT 9465 TaxID=2829794 RepID=UPI001E55D390|nr:hypothetical protein [Novosphingobium sp. CECT 9465]CAH0495015.1 hypothetical protein NVSP9465_00019 [Novosphingobium sp. CECT 9465]
MGNLILALPAALLGKLAWTSIRTGSEWTRYRQWDAVVTNIAIGAVCGGIATALAAKAVPGRD